MKKIIRTMLVLGAMCLVMGVARVSCSFEQEKPVRKGRKIQDIELRDMPTKTEEPRKKREETRKEPKLFVFEAGECSGKIAYNFLELINIPESTFLSQTPFQKACARLKLELDSNNPPVGFECSDKTFSKEHLAEITKIFRKQDVSIEAIKLSNCQKLSNKDLEKIFEDLGEKVKVLDLFYTETITEAALFYFLNLEEIGFGPKDPEKQSAILAQLQQLDNLKKITLVFQPPCYGDKPTFNDNEKLANTLGKLKNLEELNIEIYSKNDNFLTLLAQKESLQLTLKKLTFRNYFNAINLTAMNNFKNLEELELSNNSLKNTDFGELPTSLKVLKLDSCQIKTLDKIANLKNSNLKDLDLSYNSNLQLTNFESLPKTLEILNLNKCNLSNMQGISKLNNLKNLNLSYNHTDLATNLKWLKEVSKKLEVLRFASSEQEQNILAIFDALAHHTNLIWLNCSNRGFYWRQKTYQEALLSFINNHEQLKYLDLGILLHKRDKPQRFPFFGTIATLAFENWLDVYEPPYLRKVRAILQKRGGDLSYNYQDFQKKFSF